MTERIESTEIHPMRGHSRGAWYCTLDDVAATDQEAEYWAVFGVTHRGNKHCLGEFPTESAAKTAVYGVRLVSVIEAPSRRSKKIIQIEVVSDKNHSAVVELFALCDDGSLWRRGVGTGRASGLLDDRWERIPLDGMDDPVAAAVFGRLLEPQN